jgi:uncharacterized membrane protein (UPF0127 family)
VIKLDYLKHTFLLCLLTFGTQGCKESNLETEALISSDFNKQFFNFTIGKTNLKIEVAVLPEERARGLMYRESMGLMEGMLFIFENGTKQRFWMKNTRIPLDIGYFSSKGFLLEVHKAKPHDISGVPSRSSDIKFVLELNAGAYKKLDIDIGSKIDMMEIYEILKLRGLNPEDYKILPN